MNLVIIDGYLGAGKTLGMTLLSLYFQELTNKANNSLTSCTGYSNYGVKGYREFSHYRDFLDVAVQGSSMICLDEAHSDLDSRNFSTNHVKFFTHLVFYLRKVRTTLMLATPSIDNLDSRVRGIANLYVMVSKDKKYFYYDMYDLQGGKHLKRYKIDQSKAFEAAAEAFDTYNMVIPVEFPSDKKLFDEFVKELKQVSENYYMSMHLGEASTLTAAGAKPDIGHIITVENKVLSSV